MSAHCLMVSSALTGLTAVSASPCQTDTLGHGPWCGDAARTSSPHSLGERERPWKMLSRPSCKPLAVR
ncbi:MAG: hypothetical protein AW09_004674 [Candidatus Accumulibacter phosphatis]|uniref:Secreted protein n=1 Tax=Candidatus Accumulibacter phosphatis TaxID=327160 RepID=A0A084Y693_9PROT|nr:MAG: hypothetical protein AW09_004674 [Candidatus Accumulibacter phosphatis]